MSARSTAKKHINSRSVLSRSISRMFADHGAARALLGSGIVLLSLQAGAALAADTDTPPAATPVADAGTAVIVTGTRQSGVKAIDSASPIQLLDAATLERTGQPDLIQAIAQTMPSFTAQAVGGDTANLTLSARLRGISPNNTLVLVNGKRRHTTSNLAVLGGPYQGGAAADLNFIPVAAIARIEVLQDGAAAQYGTDAIAGVVNIILKKDFGGSVSTSYGQYMDGGGKTPDVSMNLGVEIGDKGYLNLTGESKYHSHSNRGAVDPRVVDPATMAAYPAMTKLGDYPNLNKISGDAAYHLQLLSVNSGYKFDADSSIYAFATYGAKTADAFENYRMPNRLPTIYPTGFSPRETIDEVDYAATFGGKGKLGQWNWDLATTYGKDGSDIGVINSANVSLYKDTGKTPFDFHAGRFVASQWTTNFDMTTDYDIGWVTPLSVAFGLERRYDTYEIGAGDPGSRYKEGSQSYPGFLLTDAGSHSRNSSAVYLDFAGSPVKDLQLDVAARFEKFSDFGNASVGKFTARYDFSPAFALRSTISSGFRAPTMAEQYYSSTNVSPTSAFVQLAPNSAGAKLVGVNGLKAEKSNNYSLGMVLHPTAGATLTVDAYQIEIKDRIVGSGSLYGSGGDVNSPAVTAAIKANGNVLDPTVTFTGINIFSNAVNTRTRGMDVVYSISSNFGDMGKVDWSVSGTYNATKVTKINQAPAQLQPQTLLDKTAIADLETASPKYRLNLGALWKLGTWTFNVREAIHGPAHSFDTYDGGVYYKNEVKAKYVTDLEISKTFNKAWTFTVGANNLFNVYPDKVNQTLAGIYRAALSNSAVSQYPSFSSVGINGGYYYARANYQF